MRKNSRDKFILTDTVYGNYLQAVLCFYNRQCSSNKNLKYSEVTALVH